MTSLNWGLLTHCQEAIDKLFLLVLVAVVVVEVLVVVVEGQRFVMSSWLFGLQVCTRHNWPEEIMYKALQQQQQQQQQPPQQTNSNRNSA
mmetsp:Transcript_67484/g.121625  ORF Transcript_67484/g.121625 Transcript_67484/m.121625 type:complete len:90 (-) Transcript_67484:88-357(-)